MQKKDMKRWPRILGEWCLLLCFVWPGYTPLWAGSGPCADPPANCGSWGGWYNGRRKEKEKNQDAPFAGLAADIQTYDPKLCTGDTDSMAWVGLWQPGLAQTGYVKGWLARPVTEVQFYYEFHFGFMEDCQRWRYKEGTPPLGYVHYKVERVGDIWRVWFGDKVRDGPAGCVQFCTMDIADYTAETHHTQTQCVGDIPNPVGFQYCKFKNSSGWQAAPGPGGWSRSITHPYGEQTGELNTQHFYIWDTRCP